MASSFSENFKAHAFVRDLAPRHSQILLECGCVAPRDFAKGEYLKRQGDAAGEFYLIRSGRVALEISLPHDGALRIDTLGKGDVLGWSWLVDPYRWRFHTRATTAVTTFGISTGCLRNECERNNEFGYAILSRCSPVIAERLQTTQLKLLDVYSQDSSASGE